MKMLIKITISSYSPDFIDSSAMPKAMAPADEVPIARLIPLLSVAPRIYELVSLYQHLLKIAGNVDWHNARLI